MLSHEDLPDYPAEELERINRCLAQLGGDPTAKTEGRRFAEGPFGEKSVVFDHDQLPPKPMRLRIRAGEERFLAVAACVLNCFEQMLRGMEVSGLAGQHLQVLGELPGDLREDLFEIEGDRTIFPFPAR